MYLSHEPEPDPSTVYRIGVEFALHPCEEHRTHGLEPESAENSPKNSRKIKLLEPFAVGFCEYRPAQVWKVKSGDETLVARIYDALFVDALSPKGAAVSVENALKDEMTAYHALTELQGISIPSYLGCFLMSVDDARSRSVHVSLLHFVPGETLFSFRDNGEPICDAHKNSIRTSTEVVLCKMTDSGIYHFDIHEKNVILSPSAPSSAILSNNACRSICQFRATLPLDPPPPVVIIDLENTTYIEESRRLPPSEAASLRNNSPSVLREYWAPEWFPA
ncbi:hypothetical protein C8R43DRAFT_1139191 [Mycena crocata]|nr:hypothetical protein C8R43DRAFT_1139191 [Mycena crocata]